jgi:hypothetical protein
MKNLHCISCRMLFVRVIHDEGTSERLLNLLKMFSFRCRLGTTRFRAFWAGPVQREVRSGS